MPRPPPAKEKLFRLRTEPELFFAPGGAISGRRIPWPTPTAETLAEAAPKQRAELERIVR